MKIGQQVRVMDWLSGSGRAGWGGTGSLRSTSSWLDHLVWLSREKEDDEARRKRSRKRRRNRRRSLRGLEVQVEG